MADELEKLRDRCIKANEELLDMAKGTRNAPYTSKRISDSNLFRATELDAKAAGVRLAISYIEEAIRGQNTLLGQ